jgi:hypothetical protein
LLEGQLLIVYADLDENLPSSQALRLAAALVKANQPYDLLYPRTGRTPAEARGIRSGERGTTSSSTCWGRVPFPTWW